MYMNRGKNIEINFFFSVKVIVLKFLEKFVFFSQIFLLISKSDAGVCLAMGLKFLDFEAECAYKLNAYKKKFVYKLLD